MNVTDVADRRRFEIAVDGTVVGFAEYRRRPRRHFLDPR